MEVNKTGSTISKQNLHLKPEVTDFKHLSYEIKKIKFGKRNRICHEETGSSIRKPEVYYESLKSDFETGSNRFFKYFKNMFRRWKMFYLAET